MYQSESSREDQHEQSLDGLPLFGPASPASWALLAPWPVLPGTDGFLAPHPVDPNQQRIVLHETTEGGAAAALTCAGSDLSTSPESATARSSFTRSTSTALTMPTRKR